MTQTISYSYKLVIVGDPSVGKTSLIRRYATKKFDEFYLPTIGADFTIKQLKFETPNIVKNVTLSIWDMGGHSRFDRIREHYYHGANAAFIIFDQTRKKTYENINAWLEDVISHCGEIPYNIIANKNDLPNKEVSKMEIHELSADKNVEIFITSAKSGKNVEKVFELIAKTCLSFYENSNSN
ncbi:MAG: Rab family GTPase [Promethearchaeota archaeon]